MNWFTVGAAVILVFFALNAAFVLTRRTKRSSAAEAARSPLFKRRLSRSQVAGMLAMVAVWVACLAAPVVAPGSELGLAMRSPWILVSVLPWSMLVAVAFSAAAMLLRRRRVGKLA